MVLMDTIKGNGFMTKKDKLIKAMHNNPKDIPFHKIESLLLYYGCQVRQPRGGSSHYIFSHQALDYCLTIPKNRPVKAHYVKNALKMIEDIKDALHED